MYCFKKRGSFIKSIWLQVMLALSILSTKAQNDPQILPMPSKPPEVSNLGRYFDFPIGTSTGIPDIGIPIWEINYGKIALPIRLSYHAGGIKVDDIASNVGLGWLLSPGGSIMKIDRSLPDKINFGFDYTDIYSYLANSMTEAETNTYFRKAHDGQEDMEPDVYTFTIPGVQGKFFELGNGEFCTVPRDLGVKVVKEGSYSWKLTDKSGNIYLFLVSDHTETVYDKYSSSGMDTNGPKNNTNIWYVSKIKDVAGNEVNFDYLPTYSSVTSKPIEVVEIYDLRYFNYGRVNKTATVATANTSGWTLDKITYGSTEIKFNYATTTRLDYSGNYALKSVEAKHGGNTVKKFAFYTSYFANNSTGTTNYPLYYAYQPTDTYRLRLDSLREENNAKSSAPYKFDYYYTSGLPYRLSNAQDHWGYYNGQNNTSFVRYYDIDGFMKGPNKEVNPSGVNECTLKKIIYPTKGYQLFDYESNTTYMTVGDPVPTTVTIGGVSGSTTLRTFNEGYIFVSDTLQLENGFYGNYTFSHSAASPTNGYGFHGIIKNADTGEEQLLYDGTNVLYIPSGGNYVIIGEILDYTFNPLYPKNLNFDITLTKIVYEPVLPDNHEGPGLRIKKITNHFKDNTDEVHIYEYDDPSTNISSGVLTNNANLEVYRTDKRFSGVMGTETANQNYVEYSSLPNYPLSAIGATYISYSYVTEYFDNQKTHGKLLTRFTNVTDFEELRSSSFISYPFKPTPFMDHKVGKPLVSEVFGYENDQYTLKKRTVSNYDSFDSLEIKRPAIKVGFPVVFVPPPGEGLPDWVFYSSSIKVPYHLTSDVYKLVKDTTYQYFANNQVVISTNHYQYSPINFEPSSVTRSSSSGENKIIRYKYPYHYVQSNNDPNGVYANLITQNMGSVPVELESFKNLDLISRKKYLYDQISLPSNNFIALREIKNWNKQIDQDESETRAELFNDAGTPVSVLSKGIVKTVLIYSYNKQHVVAEIENADYATVVGVVGGQAALDVFSASNPSDVQVKDFLAPLLASMSLKDSKITSFTYKPLVGMASATDAKGATTYYQYDDFQRLEYIKDQNGDIVKHFSYNFAP